MRLQQLVGNLTLLDRRNWKPSLEVSGISSDSRRLEEGDLFVACPGPKTDGHRYLAEAYRRGARVGVGESPLPSSLPREATYLQVPDSRGALAELLNQFHGFPSKKLDLIGITGTNGKTTIAYLLTYLLRSKLPSAYVGTLGVETHRLRRLLENTTPGAEELFSILGEAVSEGIRAVAMEVSSHALDQRRVEGLKFKLAVFTQLTPEHLDYHQSLENYFQAKRLLFTRNPRPDAMLINRDSPHGRRLLAECPSAKNFGLEEGGDYRALGVTSTFEGSEFLFEGPRGKIKFRTRLPFIHNVSNALAALACLDLLGFDPADYRESLARFPGVPGRLERIDGRGFVVFVDYAHTPDAFEHTLSEARRLKPKRILTVFGCGGDRDPLKRPEMTRIAYHYSDFVILTSDNPRTEDPSEILRQMRRGLPSSALPPKVLEIPDRREAIDELLALAEPGDVLFILGKGHEDYQILGTRKIPFDDREVVRELLKRRSRVAI